MNKIQNKLVKIRNTEPNDFVYFTLTSSCSFRFSSPSLKFRIPFSNQIYLIRCKIWIEKIFSIHGLVFWFFILPKDSRFQSIQVLVSRLVAKNQSDKTDEAETKTIDDKPKNGSFTPGSSKLEILWEFSRVFYVSTCHF